MKSDDSTKHPIETEKQIYATPKRPKTTFKGDVLRLVTGTVMAQAIGILAAPILTRLYGPESFGLAALFTSFTGIISVLACMRYELSIVLPDSDGEAANLMGVSLLFSLLVAVLTLPIVWFFGPLILHWLKTPALEPYLLLIPITVFINGIFLTLNYWNTRTKHFTRLSITRITSAVATTSTTIGAGFAGYATGGTMIVANVGGQIVATTVLGAQIWRDNGKFLVQNLDCLKMLEGVKRYKKFPIYSSWSALLNTISWQLPVLIFGVFFSPSVGGFYALGFRILKIPMSLIGSAIGQVFLQRAADAKLKGSLQPLVKQTFHRLLMICMLPMLVLAIVGKDLYILVFGEDWGEAGVYTQMLSVWAIVWFVSAPLTNIYPVLEKQHREPVIQGSILVARFIGIIIGGYFNNPLLAIGLYSLGGLIAYSYLLTEIFSFCELNLKYLLIETFNLVKWQICIIFLLALLKICFGASQYLLILSLIIVLFHYGFITKNKLLI